MIDILVAHLAHPKALGLYVGFSAVSIGAGGGLGNFMGGWLYDLGKTHGLPMLPWSVFALVGIATAVALWQFFRQHPAAISQ